MKNSKKNMEIRAFTKGYNTGLSGRSKDICPHQQVSANRQAWLSGWRNGWTDRVESSPLSGLDAQNNNIIK